MRRTATVALFLALAAPALSAQAETVSLRLGGKEIALSPGASSRLASLAREAFSRCGPNTRQHAHNFGPSALLAPIRRERTLEGSRLHITLETPVRSTSHLGGELEVTEVTIGLESEQYFVGPTFSRDGRGAVEHLQCEYLPVLEIACSADLAPHLGPAYAKRCALFQRGADGRIVMPPPDIAPSCS